MSRMYNILFQENIDMVIYNDLYCFSTNDTLMTFLSTGNAFLSFIVFTTFYIFRTTT